MRHKNFKGDVHLVPMRTKKKIDMFMPKLLFRDKKKKSNINVRFHILFCMLIAHTNAEQLGFWGRFLA